MKNALVTLKITQIIVKYCDITPLGNTQSPRA